MLAHLCSACVTKSAAAVGAIVKDAVLVAAAAAGAIVSIVGLNTWRRQIRGRAEYAQARRLLRSAYALREAIQYVRSPFMPAAELERAGKQEEADGRTPGLHGANVLARAYENRWQRVQRAATGFSAEALEAEVLWGGAATEATKAVELCVRQLRQALQDYIMYKGEPPGPDERDLFKAAQDVVFQRHGDPPKDGFSLTLAAAVGNMEDLCRRHLRS